MPVNSFQEVRENNNLRTVIYRCGRGKEEFMNRRAWQMYRRFQADYSLVLGDSFMTSARVSAGIFKQTCNEKVMSEKLPYGNTSSPLLLETFPLNSTDTSSPKASLKKSFCLMRLEFLGNSTAL